MHIPLGYKAGWCCTKPLTCNIGVVDIALGYKAREQCTNISGVAIAPEGRGRCTSLLTCNIRVVHITLGYKARVRCTYLLTYNIRGVAIVLGGQGDGALAY